MKWFNRKEILYIPASLFGWIIILAAIIYSVYSFIDIDSRSHSVSDTLMNFVFNLLIIGVVYSLVAVVLIRKKKV